MTNLEIQNNVLGLRIRLVYALKRILNPVFTPTGFKASWLLVLLAGLFWLVSVAHVFRNFLNTARDFNGAYGFVTTAFLNTGWIVQAISVGILAVGVFFAIDLYKTLLFSGRISK